MLKDLVVLNSLQQEPLETPLRTSEIPTRKRINSAVWLVSLIMTFHLLLKRKENEEVTLYAVNFLLAKEIAKTWGVSKALEKRTHL